MSTRAEADDLRDAADDLSSDLASWLADSLDGQRTKRIAAYSYWHQNGFAKLVLDQSVERTVRLHVWPAGADRLGESNPHGHRWAFGSRVLCGAGIVQRTYIEDPIGVPYVRYTYEGRDGVRSLSPVGNVHLVEDDSPPVRSGQSYAVDTSVVHTVEPLGTALTATLVVQGPARAESTVVYGRPGRTVDGADLPIDAADVLRLLAGVRAAVDGTSGSR